MEVVVQIVDQCQWSLFVVFLCCPVSDRQLLRLPITVAPRLDLPVRVIDVSPDRVKGSCPCRIVIHVCRNERSAGMWLDRELQVVANVILC